MNTPTVPYHALIDSGTNILLTASTRSSVLVLLNEWAGNTMHVTDAHYPNDMGTEFLKIAPADYPTWTWDWKKRSFSPARSDIVTGELRSRSRLFVAKQDVLLKMMFNINTTRYPIRTGLDFQENIYTTKRSQAQRFKDGGYDESTAIEYPYVLQYADYAGISLKQATDDIILKANIDDQLLAKTELLRLKYFNKMREIVDLEKIPAIYEEFIRDCFVNARV